MLNTRGKRVVAEATLPRDLIKEIMHADVDLLFRARLVSNLGGFMSGVNNNGAHSANGITALFIATARTSPTSRSPRRPSTTPRSCPNGDYYVSITIPSLIVATYGGGTGRPRSGVPRAAGLLRRRQGPQVRRDRRGHGAVRRAVARLGDRRRGVGEGPRPVREEPMMEPQTAGRWTSAAPWRARPSTSWRQVIGGGAALHRAIADRVSSGAWRRGTDVAAVRRPGLAHDAISGGVYAAMRGATGVLGLGAEVAVGLRGRRRAAPAPSTTRRGSAGHGHPQRPARRRARARGEPAGPADGGARRRRPGRPEHDALAAAFPAATPRLVVFVHGLMETELSWRLGAGEQARPTARAWRDLGCTPVDVRYNTGRHISENGRSLAELLESVVARGRSRSTRSRSSGTRWAASSRAAPATWADGGRRVGRARPPRRLAGLAALRRAARGGRSTSRRSAWHAAPGDAPGRQLPAPAQRGHPRPAPRLAGRRGLARSRPRGAARGRLPGGPAAGGRDALLRLGDDHPQPDHPVGRLIGDLLVLTPSASGRSRTRRVFRAEHGAHVGGATHFALLNHPAVYERLRGSSRQRPRRWAPGRAPA